MLDKTTTFPRALTLFLRQLPQRWRTQIQENSCTFEKLREAKYMSSSLKEHESILGDILVLVSKAPD